MMERHLAVVKQNKVSNLIVVDPDDVETIQYFGGVLVPVDCKVEIDYEYDGVNFIAPVKAVIPMAEPMPPIQEQLDALFEGGAAQAAMKARIAAIKTKRK